MLKLFIRGGLLACLLTAFTITTGKGYPSYIGTGGKSFSFDHHSIPQALYRHSIYQMPAAGSDSITFHAKYHDNLTSLIDYFGKKELAIQELLQDSRFEIYEGIGDKFRYSAEKKSLGIEEYKRILGFQAKSKKIVDFINAYADQLAKAEETYGISRHVISAIIGIESDFGANVGKYNPFNTYVSMYAVGYRSDFAKAQLEELLIWVNKNELDVFELKSSYAGAMAYAQFIPYSLNKWFVGDDIYDMNNNIMSVANYLAYFKKRTGSIEKAVFRYNPSSLYTDAVMDLAKEAESIFSNASAGR